MDKTIYKIAPEALWRAAEAAGEFTGAPIDIADGYILGCQAHPTSDSLKIEF